MSIPSIPAPVLAQKFHDEVVAMLLYRCEFCLLFYWCAVQDIQEDLDRPCTIPVTASTSCSLFLRAAVMISARSTLVSGALNY